MKIILTILLIASSFEVFSQISNTKVVRIANSTTEFGQPLSEGNILINLATDSCYLVLRPIEYTNTLSSLAVNVDYKSLIVEQDISGIATNAEDITSINSELNNKLEKSATTAVIAENTNLYYTEARVSANTDVVANTSARHSEVSLGTANGLSLSGQQISMDIASSSKNGALSATDWNSFNNKISTEVDGDATNELQKFDVAQLSGTNLELSLSDDGEAIHQIDLSSISGGGSGTGDSTFVWIKADTLFVEDNIVAVDSAHGIKINENLTIEADGTIRMDNEATVWDDLMVFPDAVNTKSANAPVYDDFINDGHSSNGIWLNWFIDGQNDEVFFTVQLPHSYKVGTDIYPHVHWTTKEGTPTKGTADVTWGLEYSIISIGGTFPNSTIIYGSEIIAPITPSGTHQHLINSLGSISGAGIGISAVIGCRLFRSETNDSFTGAAGLLGIDFHFEKDTQGSRLEYVK